MNLTKTILSKNKISLYPLMGPKSILLSIYKSFKDKKNDHYKILYKSKNLILYPRSTLSLLRIYQYLNIFKNKRTIFIPDYICNESLSLLRRTNAKIIFYDHTLIKNKKLISQLSSNKVDIFLFVNYFGKRIDINIDLLEFINKKNITLLYPEIRIYNQPNITTSEADIRTNLLSDRFITMNTVQNKDYFNIRYQIKPFMIWIWLSILLIATGGFLSLFKKKYEN